MKSVNFGVATRVYQTADNGLEVYYHSTKVFERSADRMTVTCGGYATATTVKRINQSLRLAGIDWAQAYRETRDGDTRAYIAIDRKWRVDITWDAACFDIALRANADEITGQIPFISGKIEYMPEKLSTEYGIHDLVWTDYFRSNCVHLYNPRARWQEIRYATPEYSSEPMPYVVHNGNRIYLENYTRAPKDGVFAQFDGVASNSFFSGTVITFDPEDSSYCKVRGYSR